MLTPDHIVKEIFNSAIGAVDPSKGVEGYIDKIRSNYEKFRCDKLYVVGIGKAAYQMASSLEDKMGELITDGIVITKYGHAKDRSSRLKIYEAGHPVPDDKGLIATEEIIKLVSGSDEKTLIVCLVSGGGSALFVCPYEGISLKEKQQTTDILLKAGVDISELNAVRKHISKVKGGRFAKIMYPANVLTLILSDVIGDRLDVIASGPTSPDTTSFADAIGVLDRYDLKGKTPSSVLNTLEKGFKGLIPETPKEGNKVFNKIINNIVGNNIMALDAAKKRAKELGLVTEIISSEIKGEASDVGKDLAKRAKEIKDSNGPNSPICWLNGGETTVTVTGSGKGGRNMELALSFGIEIEGTDGITFLSAGTDGTDGPTDSAGAIVNGKTAARAKKKGLNPTDYLKNNDSYTFFKDIGGLYITGPTGTNVMDIQITIIE